MGEVAERTDESRTFARVKSRCRRFFPLVFLLLLRFFGWRLDGALEENAVCERNQSGEIESKH